MASDRLTEALRSARDTREVRIAPGALQQTGEVLRAGFDAPAALFVADENTFAAAGGVLLDILRAEGIEAPEPLIFPGQPALHPDVEHVVEIERWLASCPGTPVAVGSGTLNDLVKLAAHRLDRPYLVVATAASMDGYTAFASAITHAGVKHIDDCPAPRALIADLDVLARAPAEMTAAGFGDLVGKGIAGADWIIADALGIEPMDRAAWALIGPHLRHWTGDPAGLAAGRPEAFEALFEGLVMAGLAMQAAESSRPASGSEHLFSHLWEMQGLVHQGRAPFHGFKVGLGTLAAAALWERLLALDPQALDPAALAATWPSLEDVEAQVRQDHADPQQAESAVRSSLAKHLSPEGLVGRIERLRVCWADLRPQLARELEPAAALRARLHAAGCPVRPEDIGVPRAALRAAYRKARQIRSRYTALDLAAETGQLEPSLEALFAPGGFWAET